MSKGSGRRPERNGSYRDNFDRIFNKPEPLHNAHVYTFWRWRGWVAEQRGNNWGAFFFRDWAQRELGDEE
jgi:hypothetical protein